MSRQTDVVVVGSYNQDVVLRVADLPGPGETCLALGRTVVAGGKGSNQAIQAARCGAKVAMIAAIGRDGPGEEALAVWARDGIETQRVARLEGVGTGMAMILVDAAGENSIVVHPGANAALTEAHVEAAADTIGAARLVVAQLETPVPATRRAFGIARAAGVLTLLNAAPAPNGTIQALLALTDILVVNAGEGERLSGHADVDAAGAALLEQVALAVIVTLGGKGAVIFHRIGPSLACPAIKVDVIDTTGAGDAFIGAFAARYVQASDLSGALSWGLAAGALACTVLGATPGFADRVRIDALASRAVS